MSHPPSNDSAANETSSHVWPPWPEAGTNSYGGMECDLWGGVSQCPPREACYPETFFDYEGRTPTDVPRCTCHDFFGYVGPKCKQLTGQSYCTLVTMVLVAIFVTYVCYMFNKTMLFLLLNWKRKRLKLNAAINTLILGAISIDFLFIVTWSYVPTSLLIDEEMVFERLWFGVFAGLCQLFFIPCLLNVSAMWIDTAMLSMHADERAHRFRKNLVQYAIYALSVCSTTGISFLMLMDLRTEATLAISALMILVLVSYGTSGRRLAGCHLACRLQIQSEGGLHEI